MLLSTRVHGKNTTSNNQTWWYCILSKGFRLSKKPLIRLAAVVVLILLIRRRPNSSEQPTVDIFLNHVEDPLSAALQPSCPSAIRKRAKKDLAVIVIGSSRADYLSQVLESLQKQSVDNFRVFIFLDFCKEEGCDECFQLANETCAMNPDRCSFQRAKTNIGIARMSKWAIDAVLADTTYVVERFLFIEDDHLVGHTYVEAMGMLLSASEHMPKVAMVNGNFVETPAKQTRGARHGRRPFLIKEREDDCHFQIVEPMHANTDVNGHNVWAWGTTRTKYETMYPTFVKAFEEANFTNVGYMDRNTLLVSQVIEKYCPGVGYSHWAGQDWLRACIFYHHGMTQKLQPTSRLMTYIGMRGLHMLPEVYQKLGFQPASVEEVSKNVSEYPELLCNGVCKFKVEMAYDKWEPFRKPRNT